MFGIFTRAKEMVLDGIFKKNLEKDHLVTSHKL